MNCGGTLLVARDASSPRKGEYILSYSHIIAIKPFSRNTLKITKRDYSLILHGSPRTVSCSGIRFALSVFHFFDPCGRYGRFYGVTDRSNAPLQFQVSFVF